MKSHGENRARPACLLLRSGVVSLGLLAGAAQAQYTHHIYLDTDNNPSTSCTVAVHEAGWSGNVTGVERDVQISVSTTAPAHVTGVTLSSCSGASFGAPQTVSTASWPVGLNVGTGGGDVIEGYLPRTFMPANATVRAYYHSQLNAANDVMLTTSGSGGSPMLFTLDAGTGPGAAAIPALGVFGLSIFGLAVAAAAFGLLRSRAGVAGALFLAVLAGAGVAGVAYAATITMDGQVGDWAGISALGTDPTGDSSIGDPAEDIVAGFATFDAANVCFRVDVWNVECTPATSPSATITAPTSAICGSSTGNAASVPSAGAGASYAWGITNGTITGGNGTNAITFSAGPTGPVQLTVTVTAAAGCSTSGNASVTVTPAPSISSFTATPSTISFFGTSTLNFTIANATSWSLNSSLGNSIGPASGSGGGALSAVYSADNGTGTDTVTLTVTGPCGTTTQTVQIIVN